MECSLADRPIVDLEGDWLVVGVFEDGREPLGGAAATVDQALGGWITRIRGGGDYSGKLGELAWCLTPRPAGGAPPLAAARVLVVGLGKREKWDLAALERAAATAARHVALKPRSRVIVGPLGGLGASALTPQRVAETMVEAVLVATHGQDLYKAEPKRTPFGRMVLAVDGADRAELERAIERGKIVGDAINLARDLVNEPPRFKTPPLLAERAAEAARAAGLGCTVWDAARLGAERMDALLGVAAGSAQEPRLVMLEYRPEAAGPVLGLVGKGVTFDSGGLSLKQGNSMDDMKCDMAGAATVLAAMQAIARLGLPIRALGLMGCVENMPGGSALKLGDVLRARNGKTIEVLNTDAEGRLVLADLLSYAVERGVSHLVDLATLTGSCVVALGTAVAGLMTNHQAWADRVLAACRVTGERAWQLPLYDDYGESLKSGVADLKNIGGRWAGALTAAKFLENFVSQTPWVHLDIAGPSWMDKDNAWHDAGGTGCFVRTLVELAGGYAAGTPGS